MDINNLINDLKKFSISVENKTIKLSVPASNGRKVEFNFTDKGTTICTQ